MCGYVARVQRMNVRWKTGMRRETEMESLIARAVCELKCIKRYKTTMKREILQLCQKTGFTLFTSFTFCTSILFF